MPPPHHHHLLASNNLLLIAIKSTNEKQLVQVFKKTLNATQLLKQVGQTEHI